MAIPCEVIEGDLRDAIIYACGVNSTHGMPRTNPDKQNAVTTMLTNPLVMINLETGKPWNDSEIARRCAVGHDMVRRRREAILRSAQDTTQEEEAGPEERTVTRGGTTYTMKTANIGGTSPKVEQPPAAGPAPGATETSAPGPLPEAQPEPAKAAVVVKFKSKWDFIYEHLKEIDRAIAVLPAPNVVASELPVAHRPEMLPTGPKQRRHLPPPSDGFGRTAPVFQSVLVAWLATDPINAAVEPTAGSPRHSR
jgi:hypothetical protein